MEKLQYLISPEKTWYKVSLHTHSTLSDGKLTPEEVKAEYKARGFSVVALTDHSLMSCQQHLNDEEFIFLSGQEMDVTDPTCRGRTYHMNLISKDPYLLWTPVWDPGALPNMLPHMEACRCENMPLEYTPENLNAIIRKARDMGFLVMYNHPQWSQQHARDYLPLEGLWAAEYRNSGCVMNYGLDQNNEQVYAEILEKDPRVVPVIADDMHKIVGTSGKEVLGAGWVMAAAEELTYEAVFRALENRELYASCGPEIRSLTWDGQKLSVSCSPASSVRCIANHKSGCKIFFAGEGEQLTEATFDLSRWAEKFAGENRQLRVVVTAPDGTYAVSRNYTAEDFSL